MSNRMWDATIEHAWKCVLDDKIYSYCDGQGIMLLFNSVYQPLGAILDQNFYQLDELPATHKVHYHDPENFCFCHAIYINLLIIF